MLNSSAMLGGRRIEIARVADDLGAAAAVVGHVAQRGDVHAIVAAGAVAPAAAVGGGRAAGSGRGRRGRPRREAGTASAPAWRRRPCDATASSARRRRRCRSRRPAPRSRESAACTLAERRACSTCRCRPRSRPAPSCGSAPAPRAAPLGDGVVHRRAAVRRERVRARATSCCAIAGPALQQRRIVAEAIEEDLVLVVEQVVQEAVERARASSIFSPAMLPLVSSAMPRLTGTRSALKCVTSTGWSSS